MTSKGNAIKSINSKLKAKNSGKIRKKRKNANVSASKNFTLEREGARNVSQGRTSDREYRKQHQGTLGSINLVERERELVTDLFGDNDVSDSLDDATHSPQPYEPPIETQDMVGVAKKREKKKKGERETNEPSGEVVAEDQMIPDDPYDIHGITVKEKRKPAWVDEEDEQIKVKDVMAGMTKARGTRGVRETSEQQYSTTLKERFLQVVGGTPEWAVLDRPTREGEEESALVRSTGDFLAKSKSGSLPKTRLQFKRVCNLNINSKAEGSIITAVEFNPHFPVGLVAGLGRGSGTATLFKVDGVTNHKIQSVKFPSFPIHCAKFLDDGKRFVVVSSAHNHFFVYDMETGQETRVHSNVGRDMWKVKKLKVSPDGKFMVFIGKGGLLHVFDAQAVSHVATLYAPQQVNDIAFNDSGTKMFSHGDGGDVCVWDIEGQQCVHRFYDDGCIDGTTIAACGRYVACGSTSGVVNVYDSSSLSSSAAPTPVKSLTKLYTPITTLAFNATGEMLAEASNQTENALKLVHFPSMTYFENFPLGQKGLQRVNVANFSPHGGFLGLGNNSGTSYLFRLSYYSAY